MTEVRGRMTAEGRRFAVIVSRWNELITEPLLVGALDTIQAHGNDDPLVIRVPGTWEIPAVAASLLAKNRVDAVICLGCILQGATSHAQQLADEVGRALMELQTHYQKPVAWGILTPETSEQAFDRAGLKVGHKGREAALAAIETADVLSRLEG